MTQCGASFTVISVEHDSAFAEFGFGSRVDTARVCETWTGSDYVLAVKDIGSSSYERGFADAVRGVVYQNGSFAPYDAQGAQMADAVPVAPTVFEFVGADAETREAASDDPYYGIRAVPIEDVEMMASPPNGASQMQSVACARGSEVTCGASGSFRAQVAASGATGRFKRHGLKRRGVRALVEHAEDIGRNGQGHRRFRKVRGDQESILTLDRDTELLIEEETASPDGRVTARHKWKADDRGGYVKTQTDVDGEFVEKGGRRVRSRSVLTYQDVRINDGGAL